MGGRLWRIKDANNVETTYEYDQFDWLESINYADSTCEEFGYDKGGHLNSYTNRAGQVITYAYDALGRLKRKNRPNESATTIVYNMNSRPIRIRDGRIVSQGGGTWAIDYDRVGRPETVTYAGQWTVGYEYDNLGRVKKLTYPDESWVTYEYDKLGRLRKIKDEAGDPIARYFYDELGRRDIVYYGNGTSIDYSFDMGNRLSSITNNFMEQYFDALKFEYDTYDKVGNRKDCDITLGPTTLSAYAYGYDSLYELKQVDLGGTNFGKYVYDKLGNRKKTIINSNTVVYSPNELNQYHKVDGTTLSYDNKGNLTYDGTHSYTYDCENRLLTTLGQTFKYDVAGRRIRKTIGGTTTQYVYDGARLIAECENSVVVRKYIYGPGLDEPVLLMVKDGANWLTYYYHYDGLGSVVGLSDEDGYLKDYYAYDVFGQPTMYYAHYPTHTLVGYNLGSGLLQPFMFTGREYDFGSGLYYYRFRFYHPTLGRFMQPDPIGYYDSMNLYAYCLNNSLNRTDPFGLSDTWNWGWWDIITFYPHAWYDLGCLMFWGPSEFDDPEPAGFGAGSEVVQEEVFVNVPVVGDLAGAAAAIPEVVNTVKAMQENNNNIDKECEWMDQNAGM